MLLAGNGRERLLRLYIGLYSRISAVLSHLFHVIPIIPNLRSEVIATA